jgi:hypothetical protein
MAYEQTDLDLRDLLTFRPSADCEQTLSVRMTPVAYRPPVQLLHCWAWDDSLYGQVVEQAGNLEPGLEVDRIRRGVIAPQPYFAKVRGVRNGMSVGDAFDAHAEESIATRQLAREDQVDSGNEVRIGVVGQHERDAQPYKPRTNEARRHETIVCDDNFLERRVPTLQQSLTHLAIVLSGIEELSEAEHLSTTVYLCHTSLLRSRARQWPDVRTFCRCLSRPHTAFDQSLNGGRARGPVDDTCCDHEFKQCIEVVCRYVSLSCDA